MNYVPLPQKELKQSWNLGEERLGAVSCFRASYMATANLQLLEWGGGCVEDSQQLPPCFQHQQMRDGHPVLLYPFRFDLFGLNTKKQSVPLL